MDFDIILSGLDGKVAGAVASYWRTRDRQARKQKRAGRTDQGARGAVTGGGQMAGFIKLFTDLICRAGISRSCLHWQKGDVDIPGYYRASKEWDLLVIHDERLLVSIECKSQVGSFGNNLNNRTEEAIGSAVDLWTAHREKAYGKTSRPWLGYLFMLQDCPASQRPVNIRKPHFRVFPEFVDASYARRYEILCRKLAIERKYDAVAFLMSDQTTGRKGVYSTPADDLSFELFARSLVAHVAAFA